MKRLTRTPPAANWMTEIFGYTDRQTQKYAHDLGLAFQLTNILRDVGEDARRGRIYLPTAELEQFQVTQDDLLAAHYTDNFRRLMQFQAERAEQTYQRALAQLPACDRNRQRPGLIMARIYHQLLKKIRRHDYQVLDRRIALTSFGKLWLVGLSLQERPMP